VWLFIAIDRKTKTILGFRVGKRTQKEAESLRKDLKKYNIINLHTDNCKIYKHYSKKHIHTVTKNETTQVESVNSVVRSYLGRFKRKGKGFTKSVDSMKRVLYVFFAIYNQKFKKYFDDKTTFDELFYLYFHSTHY
jgi:IS1 family transposase